MFFVYYIAVTYSLFYFYSKYIYDIVELLDHRLKEEMLITNETTYKLLSDREECNQALYSLIITGHACHYMHNGNLVYSSNGNLLVGNNRNLKYFMFVNGWNNSLFWYNL